jgi:hypothetical protein
MRSNDPCSPENEQKVRRRYVPKAAFALAERLKAMGVKLGISRGPWRTDEHLLNRRGRNGLDAIPIVTNGETEVMVDTLEHAVDLAGLLNYSGVDTLNPVPDLTVPLELQPTKPA